MLLVFGGELAEARKYHIANAIGSLMITHGEISIKITFLNDLWILDLSLFDLL